MKFFHLSDLHIGLRLYNRDLGEDQDFVFDQIAALAREHQPDAIVVAGDLYDKAVPSAEAVERFDRFVCRLSEAAPRAQIMMISGNHDSGPRVNLFRTVLARHNLHMIGLPPTRPDERIETITLEDEYGPVCFYLLPYVRPSMVRAALGEGAEAPLTYQEALAHLLARETPDPAARNVLVSHQFYLPVGADPDQVERTSAELRTVGNVDAVSAALLAPFDYAALGHIHRPMQVGSPQWRYCGTPLAYSVDEAGQQKGVVLVELREKGVLETSVLPLTPLRQVRVIQGPLEEVLAQGCADYVTVILTDPEDYDVFDLQDRLRAAFPYLLEIRREALRGADYAAPAPAGGALDPYGLCCAFLPDLGEEERALLREILDELQEVQ